MAEAHLKWNDKNGSLEAVPVDSRIKTPSGGLAAKPTEADDTVTISYTVRVLRMT